MTHSILAPSSFARIVQCPGSLTMEAGFPETDEQRTEALEGEAAHWAMAEMLEGRLVDVGQTAANGVVLTREMVEGADMIYDDVCRVLAPYGLKPTDGATEVTVDIKPVHPLCFGTPDYRIWIPARAPERMHPKLIVWDFKFGHRLVEAYLNWQLILYVIGILQQASAADLYIDVEVRIVQPRAYHAHGPIRSWSFKGSDLRPRLVEAIEAANAALGPGPVTRVGPECRDCRARHACPSLQRAAMDACDIAGLAQPLELPPAALGVELRMLKRAASLLSARISGLEEQVLGTIRRGKLVPGWGVGHGEGRLKWTVPDEHVIAMGKMLGIDVAKPPAAITPLQAIDKGLTEVLVNGISQRLPGAATLVEDDGSAARRVFSRSA